MPYNVLSEEEQDDIIVNFILAQERDEFCHATNLARYDKMLETLPRGPWRERIVHLSEETAQRLLEVRSIIAATRGQLPPEPRLNKALVRVKAAG